MTMRRALVWLMGTAMAATLGLGATACTKPVPENEPKDDVVEVQDKDKAKDTDNTDKTDKTEGTDDKAEDNTEGTDDKTIEGTDSQTTTEKTRGVAINLSDDSILTFDNNAASAQLVEDMRAGKIPTSCTVRYDQMGARPTVTVTDARTIRNVYKKLARMHVEGPSNTSMTDNYHLVSFELQDGTVASFNFEGAGILVRKDQNYAVLDKGGLWTYVQELQDQYIEEQNAGPNALAITLEDDDEIVARCPKVAKAGETVRVSVYMVEGADRHLAINDDESYGKFVSADEYEFVMPDKPVTVRAWLTSDYPDA